MPRTATASARAAGLLVLAAAVAPWMAVLLGAGWVVAAILATLGAGAGLWLFRRALGAEEAGRVAAEKALESLAREAGAPGEEILRGDRAAERVRSRLQTESARSDALAAVMNAIEEPVLALDRRCVVTLANRAAAEMLASGARVPLAGRPLDQLLPDERSLEAAHRALGGAPGRIQTRILTPSGPRIFEVAAEPVEAGGIGGPAAVVSMRDVTEQATAMQLKTDFVANASHELRTPLASIKAAAETLADLGDDPGPVLGRLVSMIATNAERLEELSRDLLDLSSMESPERESVRERIDAAAMAEDLRGLFESACAERRINLEIELDDRLRSTWTDGRLLRLILRNLIDNAIKFAYEGTTVRLRGTVRPAEGKARDDARFEVEDQGIGIPIGQQHRIFERFFQVDASRTGPAHRRGTGLGLAIVKHALRAIGGTIHVRSVWRQGTTMTVDLPQAIERASVSAGSG